MIQKSHTRSALRPGYVRLAALVLTALTLCAALLSRPSQAAEWMQPYLEQVQAWGVMRGDANGNLNEDRPITRAEFVTMMNRAFGYTDVGPNPFSDVEDNAWYAEDIRIAHQAGYFYGNSDGAANPMNLVTREQAAVMLGRCLRFQGIAGAANSTFTDMQEIGGWSRGYVQEAAELGIIQGYGDGSFRPKQAITRGQMACFLVRALGTLVQEPGEQTTGGVYGNLTITTPGVKLKDTTVTGNLYLTGGVGLGDVELENVTVLGKIVITGGGEAEGGQHSVILRNVTAGSLEVDSLTEQFLSIMAEGLTNIGTTTVRTSAYVEDRTDDGLGFQTLRLDGVEGSKFQLAGNIKQVVDLTPGSTLQIAQGVADIVTMDEKALDASLIIDNIANIRELNLDTAAKVTGDGSIGHLNINAPGSDVSMLPDTIYVRPGITGNINKVDMDNKVANESSADPRLLAGYPAARNVAPTSADAVFRTNKAGTIYWAVTALMDGSLGEEELMDPGSYPKILRSGTLNATAANTDFTARVTGLTREGSYYISALLVDARGRRSPVKIAAFTTPDDSAPNFATGYPQDPILTTDADGEQVAQIMVMPTKDCQLYYVLLPKGSTAPTAADFRAAALPGNLGYGVVTVRKNTPFLISRINTSHLQEKTDYDLYLWLNDADNGKSSAVRKVTVTTKDITPPTITSLYVKSYTATTVTLGFTLDEPGTLSWAAVTQGASIRVNKDDPSKADQIKIENIPADGNTVVRRGGPVRAAREGTEVTFTVSGLQAEATYDLYYTAKDTAGNYCVYNKSIAFPFPIRTQDSNAPSAEVWLNRPDPVNDTPTLRYTLLNGDVGIQFTEVVQGYDPNSLMDDDDPIDFLDLYNRVVQASGEAKERAKRELANALKEHITLYPGTPSGDNEPTVDPVPEVTADTTAEQKADMPAWIDYREAVVIREGGKTRIVFPNGTGIKMQSGSRYFFRVEAVQDTADSPNKLAAMNVPAFATVSAQVDIGRSEDGYVDPGTNRDYTIFRLSPHNTEYSPESARWDMLLWAESSIEFNLFVRRVGDVDWFDLGVTNIWVTGNTRAYRSLTGTFSAKMIESGFFGMDAGHQGRPYLNRLTDELEFGILSTPSGQDGDVKMEAELYTGTNIQLGDISLVNRQGTDATFSSLPEPLERISNPKSYEFTVRSDLSPRVQIATPISVGSTGIDLSVSLNMGGRVFCMAIPVTPGAATSTSPDFTLPLPDPQTFYPKKDGNYALLSSIPDASQRDAGELLLDEDAPRAQVIIDGYERYLDQGVRWGSRTFATANDSGTVLISDLSPSTTYVLYLVGLETRQNNETKQVLCYQFTTDPPEPPKIALDSRTASLNIRVRPDSQMRYIMVERDAVRDSKFYEPFNARQNVAQDKVDLLTKYGFTGTTVLDAMNFTVEEDSGYYNSIFDLCATDAIKQACYDAIIDPEASNAFQAGTVGLRDRFRETAPDALVSESGFFTFEELDVDVPYVLLVVTKAPLSTAYGFRSQWEYFNQATTSIRANCDFDEGTNLLTVQFNLVPYYSESSGQIHQIDSCVLDINHGSDQVSPNGFVKITDPAPMGSTWTLVSPAQNQHEVSMGRLWEFRVSAPSEGRRLSFENLCDSVGNTVTDSSGRKISLDIELHKVDDQWVALWPREWGGTL